MSASQKQKPTKKQKKAQAFRERKTGKFKANFGSDGLVMGVEDEDNALPVVENQDTDDREVEDQGCPAKKATAGGERLTGKWKDKGKKEGGEKGHEYSENAPGKLKKRKLESDVLDVDANSKKQKTNSNIIDNSGCAAEARKNNAVKQRYLLFVGNLKYTTSPEAIEAHFSTCDPPPTVRLLTPKPTLVGTRGTKSKGCAFLEFTHRNALQQALKFHQSMLNGRIINVELTAGGGGKGDNRIKKLKERNKALLRQREDRLEKSDPRGESIPSRAQRFSSTSGIEQASTAKRTWTVGDDNNEIKHRGGKRQSVYGRDKGWGTGVNALPIG